jgi:hypothetical protein
MCTSYSRLSPEVAKIRVGMIFADVLPLQTTAIFSSIIHISFFIMFDIHGS